jgi:hypothetical protein
MSTKLTVTDFDFSTLTAQLTVPLITSIDYPNDDTAALPAGGEVITITGTGFSTPTLYLDGTALTLTSSTSTSIVFTSIAKASGSYSLKVVNSDGIFSFFTAGFQYSGFPTWSTPSGSLGTTYETKAISTQLSATSDSAVTYSIFSGSLPTQFSLSSSGLISGTLPSLTTDATYNFTVSATDAEMQNTERNFSVITAIDVVTWTSAPPSTFTGSPNVAITPITFTATSAAGYGVTYSVDTLPAGLSLSGNTISGTPTTSGPINSIITATAATTGRTTTSTIAFTIAATAGQSEYITPGTYTWVAPAGVTSVCVVCVAGGGGGHSYLSYARGGGGGGLGYINNYTVTPGSSYTVVVGAGGAKATYGTGTIAGTGGPSYFVSTAVVGASGGIGGARNTNPGGAPGGVTAGTGFSGGTGGMGYTTSGGGGGAAGYAGNGGSGYVASNTVNYAAGNAGTGGGGGGGGSSGDTFESGGGGGVGIYGQGANGTAGAGSGVSTKSGGGGGGGSGGTAGAGTVGTAHFAANGGSYGGGGGGSDYTNNTYAGAGGGGAVRIIWGAGRAFPATNTGNM